MPTLANLVTAFRLLLFAGFIYAADAALILPAALLFTLAWALDGVDGVLARHLHQTTGFGFVFDKVVDRLVLVGGVLVLLVTGLIPLYALFLATKDILLIPVIVRYGSEGKPLRDLGRAGKVLTVLQGSAVLWLLLGGGFGPAAVGFVAGFGVVVAVRHLRRMRL